MHKVQILGAGSAGTHLANAFNALGCNVTIYDKEEKALNRQKHELWEKRYNQSFPRDIGQHIGESFVPGDDIYVLATPPTVRLNPIQALKFCRPKGVLIEKPLCTGDVLPEVRKACESLGCTLWVNYNHLRSPAVMRACAELQRVNLLAPVRFIKVEWRESLQHIANAHWWQITEQSYLMDRYKGGGASYEHSHGIALANLLYHETQIGGDQNLAHTGGMYFQNEEYLYDEISVLNMVGEHGMATIISDFITSPPIKRATAYGQGWEVSINFSGEMSDRVEWRTKDGCSGTVAFTKSRAGEFIVAANDFLKAVERADKDENTSYAVAVNTVNMIRAMFHNPKNSRVVKSDEHEPV